LKKSRAVKAWLEIGRKKEEFRLKFLFFDTVNQSVTKGRRAMLRARLIAVFSSRW
jgi:hypothetical protein